VADEAIAVRPYLAGLERAWAVELLDRELGGPLQARRAELIDVLTGSGLVGEIDREPVGLLTYNLRIDGWELTALAVVRTGVGVGTALIEALIGEARAAGADRIWTVTTNDNLPALGLYQGLGFRLIALRPGAVNAARTALKPSISRFGHHDLPIRDELELELPLSRR
jgi:ribosomal protein S18 acetylase RimI-like enzyme